MGSHKKGTHDTPVDGATKNPISSNWAYDHNLAVTGVHGVGSDKVGIFSGFIKLTVGTETPTSPETGDLWVDTS